MNAIFQALIALCLTAASSSFAQDYPARPPRIIAGNPGATADILARQIGRHLAERWGQPVIVDNRGGAAAIVATELAAAATADGYTLLMGQLNSHALAVSLHRRLPYDPVTDFAPITLVASAPQVLVTSLSVPASSWYEYASYARQRPRALNYASAGHGSASHLTSELAYRLAGLELVHIGYKGGAAAVRAIAGGEAHAGFVPVATALPVVQSGKVRALGVASSRRCPALPEVPTLHESGLTGFQAASWFGLLAPARTPRALVVQLNRDVVEILRTPSVQHDLIKQGAEAAPGTPEDFLALIKTEIARWREVIPASGLSPT